MDISRCENFIISRNSVLFLSISNCEIDFSETLGITRKEHFISRNNESHSGIFSERIFDCNPSLAVNGKAAAVLGSIPASADPVESEERQMKQCGIKYLLKK